MNERRDRVFSAVMVVVVIMMITTTVMVTCSDSSALGSPGELSEVQVMANGYGQAVTSAESLRQQVSQLQREQSQLESALEDKNGQIKTMQQETSALQVQMDKDAEQRKAKFSLVQRQFLDKEKTLKRQLEEVSTERDEAERRREQALSQVSTLTEEIDSLKVCERLKIDVTTQ